MKQIKTLLITSMAAVFFTFSGAVAGNMSHPAGNEKAMDHGSHGKETGKMDHSTHGKEMGTMDHSTHMGQNIHNATVEGYQLAYHVLDMREKMKSMKSDGPAHQMMTHHLMVYVNDPAGNPVASAKAGYLVTGPNGADQKVMCMAMGVGGYGADVDFSSPGVYKLTSKIVAGDKTIKDSFDYTVQ